MHEIVLSGYFREELQRRIWGKGLFQEGPIGSCSVIHSVVLVKYKIEDIAPACLISL